MPGSCRGWLDPGALRCFATICACQRIGLVAVAHGIAALLGLEAAPQFRLARQPRLFFGGLFRGRGVVGALLLGRLLVGGRLLRRGLLGGRLGRGLLLGLASSASSRCSALPAPSAPARAFCCSSFSCSSFSCGEALFFLLAFDLGRIRLGRALLFDGRRLGFGLRAGSAAWVPAPGPAAGATSLSARSSTTVASMASVVDRRRPVLPGEPAVAPRRRRCRNAAAATARSRASALGQRLRSAAASS